MSSVDGLRATSDARMEKAAPSSYQEGQYVKKGMSWHVPFTVVTVTKLVGVPVGAVGAVTVIWSGAIDVMVAGVPAPLPVGVPEISGTKSADVPDPDRNPAPLIVTAVPAEPDTGLTEAQSGGSSVYSKMSAMLPLPVALVPAGVVTVTK